jgi:hypothetical protein
LDARIKSGFPPKITTETGRVEIREAFGVRACLPPLFDCKHRGPSFIGRFLFPFSAPESGAKAARTPSAGALVTSLHYLRKHLNFNYLNQK